MTIELPEAPVLATISMPTPPTINLPDTPSPTTSEPTISDPTGPLRSYSYARYASAINDLLDGEIQRLLTWEGDATLYALETDVDRDALMEKLLSTHETILSASANKGFLILPGHARKDILLADVAVKRELQNSALKAQEHQAEIALKFIDFASKAGVRQVKYGVDENKRIVYANIDAATQIAEGLIKEQESHVSIFQGKVKLYAAKLDAVDTQFLSQKATLAEYDNKVTLARQDLKANEILLDQKHTENLGIALTNAKTLLEARECLQTTERERQLVLQTHAIIQGYLGRIEQVRAGLLENSAEISIVRTDLANYKNEAQLAEQQARNVLAELASADKQLDQAYQLSMAQAKSAKAEISRQETRVGTSSSEGRALSENFKYEIQTSKANAEILDSSTVSENEANVSAYSSSADAHLASERSRVSTSLDELKVEMDVYFQAAIQLSRGCAAVTRAENQAQANTELSLIHSIS